MDANPLSVSLLLGYCPSPCTYYESQATTAMLTTPGRLIPSLSVSLILLFIFSLEMLCPLQFCDDLKGLNSKRIIQFMCF